MTCQPLTATEEREGRTFTVGVSLQPRKLPMPYCAIAWAVSSGQLHACHHPRKDLSRLGPLWDVLTSYQNPTIVGVTNSVKICFYFFCGLEPAPPIPSLTQVCPPLDRGQTECRKYYKAFPVFQALQTRHLMLGQFLAVHSGSATAVDNTAVPISDVALWQICYHCRPHTFETAYQDSVLSTSRERADQQLSAVMYFKILSFGIIP
jgi:hypothetical protein